ncbi:MAG TPA: TonB-dependent receptor [Kiritimatiellia bacterium]|jgi:iron complex outermembrane receptor protein
MKRSTFVGIGPFVCAAILGYSPVGWSDDGDTNDLAINITETSLEDLLNMDVTTASRRSEKLRDAASAVYVITEEEIHRSGAIVLPELFRYVPGMDVAKRDAGKWSISIRGFNSASSQKVLALIDGRTLYDPLVNTTYWEVQDLVLEDIERIEVNRGPGGALWGANAFNGVINIITKSAKDTQGGLFTAGLGSEAEYFESLRYGWEPADNLYMRVYTKSYEFDEGFRPDESHDDWRAGRVGMRLDWEPDADDTLTVKAHHYKTVNGLNLPPNPNFPSISDNPYVDVEYSGADALMQWLHAFDDDHEMTFLTFYDHFELDNPVLGERRDTAAVDIQDHIRRDRHDVVVGAEYRYTQDEIDNSDFVTILPDERNDDLYSVFGQYEYALVPDRVKVSLGAKVENNSFTGNEFQPDARIAWTPDATVTWWASVARAVRIPSRLESDSGIRITNAITATSNFDVVTSDFDSEELVAYETGLRMSPAKSLLLDLALFYNDYDNLSSFENSTSLENMTFGNAYGSELSATWQALDWWQVVLNYSFFKMNLDVDDGSTSGPAAEGTEEADPEQQVGLRSFMELTSSLQLDLGLRFVDELESRDVPEYLVADGQLIWKAARDLELALVVRNALDNHHPEQSQTSGANSEVEDSVYGKATWTF